MYRVNSTVTMSADGDVRRETENGREFLVVPGIMAKETVYEYDWGNEYLPEEDLEPLTGRAPIALDHPITANGMATSVNSPQAINNEVVGDWREGQVIESDGEAKVRGEYWLRLDKRDVHPGYSDALDTLEDGGTVPTSPGYDPDIEYSSGRFNGQEYDAVQRNPSLDHVGLMVTSGAQARCTPEEGCAVGRANADVGAVHPESMQDQNTSDRAILSRLNGAAALLTGRSLLTTSGTDAGEGCSCHDGQRANADVDDEPGGSEGGDGADSDADGGDGGADDDDGAGGDVGDDDPDGDDGDPDQDDATDGDADEPNTNTDSDTMSGDNNDDDRIETLVEETDFSQEFLENASEDDLDALEQTYVEADGDDDGGDDGTDADADTDTDGGDGDDGEYLTRDEAEELFEQQQNAGEHERLTEEITANADFDEEDLKGMSLEGKRKLADRVDDDDAATGATPGVPDGSGGASRTNMQGFPGQVTRANSRSDDDDVEVESSSFDEWASENRGD